MKCPAGAYIPNYQVSIQAPRLRLPHLLSGTILDTTNLAANQASFAPISSPGDVLFIIFGAFTLFQHIKLLL